MFKGTCMTILKSLEYSVPFDLVFDKTLHLGTECSKGMLSFWMKMRFTKIRNENQQIFTSFMVLPFLYNGLRHLEKKTCTYIWNSGFASSLTYFFQLHIHTYNTLLCSTECRPRPSGMYMAPSINDVEKDWMFLRFTIS